MFSLKYNKPIGKCMKCGADIYSKRDKDNKYECKNCGKISISQINYYIYQSNSILKNKEVKVNE